MPLTSPRFASNQRLLRASENNPPLRRGERGQAVQIVQQTLIDLGHALPVSTRKHGRPDGIFGAETKSAVRDFQKRFKLGVDGIVGRNTMAVLDRYAPDGGFTPAPVPDPEASINYVVSGMTLIPQERDMSCWWASSKMLVKWHRDNRGKTDDILDPSQVPSTIWEFIKNDGISDAYIATLARNLGFKSVPPMTPTLSQIKDWLEIYGPLWVNGWRHITVIAGVRNTGADPEVLVYDPAPVGEGKIEWRSLPGWYISNPHSGRDENTQSGIFLHLP